MFFGFFSHKQKQNFNNPTLEIQGQRVCRSQFCYMLPLALIKIEYWIIILCRAQLDHLKLAWCWNYFSRIEMPRYFQNNHNLLKSDCLVAYAYRYREGNDMKTWVTCAKWGKRDVKIACLRNNLWSKEGWCKKFTFICATHLISHLLPRTLFV